MGTGSRDGELDWRLQCVSLFVEREWGDFELIYRDDVDGWDREANRMVKNDFGVFEIVVKAVKGATAIQHNSKVKVSGLTVPSGD